MRFEKQGKTKKHIAILLVLAMLLTIMPMSVFAEGDGGSEPTPEVATPITLIGGTETIIEKAGLFDVTAQFTTAGMVQWTIGDVTQGEAVATVEITLEDETVVYTTTLPGVTLVAGQTITATLTLDDGTESVTAIGTVAKETEIAETTVAMIDDEQYEALNTAYEVAKNSAQPVEIKLLDNVTSDFLFMNNENSDITLDLNGNTLSIGRTYTKDEWYSEGFGVGGKLTFKNGNIVSEEQIASGETFTIKATGTLNFENCNVLIGGNETYTAIYNEGIVNINGGNFKVLNTSGTGDAFYSDYKTTEINITNANIEIDNTSRFIVNSKSNIDNSTISVKNLRAIGMNESDTVMKKSVLKMDKVNNHGFTNGTLHMYDSTMELNECGNIGVNLDGDSLIDNSTLKIQNCGGIETSGRSALVVKLSTDPSSVLFKIQNNSNLIVENNKQGGIYVSGLLSQDETSNVSVIQNELTITGKYNTGKGGGISNIGNVCLNKNAKVYNNHAAVAGDDIYNADNATIIFGATGDDWALDGNKDGLDCNNEAHAIDGWYDDNENNRWEADAENYEENYVVLYPVAKDVSAVLETKKALKAAHGLAPEEVPVIPPMDWEISKSKTATNLDKNFQSKVTLSLPAAEEELVTDVVFVLDKSTSADLEEQALNMLTKLKEQIKDTNAKVKVGVVIFNKEAHATEFLDLATQYVDIEAAIKQDISSGTNTHAGLLAGKAMLDKDVTVQADRKYLIFVSDGITYMYNAEPTATAWSWQGDSVQKFAGPENWNSKYATNEPPADWMSWLKTVKAQVNQQGTQYEYPYGGTSVNATPVEKKSMYANSVDKALYLTYMEYQAAVAEGYHCYAMNATDTTGTANKWGPSFMDYLAGGEMVDFTTIQNDIYYLLDADSTVDDYIGYVADDYNFDFINDASAMTLKVGDTEYKAEKIDENKYGFAPNVGEYDYVVEYIAGDKTITEHFVWTINVPVSKFTPVQLTYTVQLMNPKSEEGTYGNYDNDGSKNDGSLDFGLYTNSRAILYPVDSNGGESEPEEFQKPTVSYKVDEDGPGPGPNPDPDPDKPTVDIPDPDVPLTEPDLPEEPTIDIDEPEVPLTDVPGEEVEIDEPEVPLGDAPKTGDAAPVVGLVGLMAAAVIGLAITRRKLN